MVEDGATRNGLTTHAARNQAAWDASSDEYQERHGGFLAASGGLAWGTSQIPEAELHVLGEIVGRDSLELGCGAAQWSIVLEHNSAEALAWARLWPAEAIWRVRK